MKPSRITAVLAAATVGAVSAVLTVDPAAAATSASYSVKARILTITGDGAADDIVVGASASGRILVNGFGTGVEVGHAMVHGGPFPATSDTRTTSVGARAMERFLRPVSYQDLPDALLPEAIRSGNPLNVPQRIDGVPAPREANHV